MTLSSNKQDWDPITTHISAPYAEEEDEVENGHDELEERAQPHLSRAQLIDHLPADLRVYTF